MDLPEIERFVTELLATGAMNDDTRADLERILAEARAGEAYPDDLDYLRALHARVLSAGEISTDAADIPEHVESHADLQREIAQLRGELEDARRTIVDLEARLASAG